jgi:hypothetical protein
MPSGGATSGDRSEPPEAAGSERRAEDEAGGDQRAEGRRSAETPRAEGRLTGAARARAGRPGPNGEAVPVAVTWDERARRPVAFVWRRRRYQVERVLETWVLETGWWKDEGHVSRSYWRVRAGGRVVDLRYDRLARAWALERELG